MSHRIIIALSVLLFPLVIVITASAMHGMTSVPAYPASHGCVRMTVPTMDRMWSSLWVGMPVAIYST